MAALEDAPSVASVPVRAPRIGLHKPWVASMDEGWTRWLLEQYEFPFRSLTDADVRRGGLRGAYDVIVLADSTGKQLLDGHRPGVVPDEYVGGLGLEGALALKEFVRAGGTLVTLDSASELAIDLFGLGVRNVLKGVASSEYYCPGGLLRVNVDTSHPLAFGLPKELVVFVENGPVFEVEKSREEWEEEAEALSTERAAARAIATFPEKDVLYSGWLLGESKITNKAAWMEVPLGEGRVVLVGFRSQFRGQPHGTFKVLFNALLAGAPASTESRPTAPAR
jgi:hypothetical protein